MLSMAFVKRCIRILNIARRPTKRELDAILKITGLGILLVGSFGMAMYLLFRFI
jgi:protein translocase SEC61 complex gamma subunit